MAVSRIKSRTLSVSPRPSCSTMALESSLPCRSNHQPSQRPYLRIPGLISASQDVIGSTVPSLVAWLESVFRADTMNSENAKVHFQKCLEIEACV